MGGALAGELASRISVQTLGELASEGSDEERLTETIRLANRRVAERATSDPRASGMGSTVTAALVGARAVTFAHVGDSRAYLWRGGVLTRLSDDHSLVAEWVRAGALAPEEAAQHPQRSVITRALGADWQVDVDVWTTPARAGDVILLCTDGLSGFVDDAAVARALGEHDDLDAAVHALVDAANASGGEDNITAVAIRLEADDEQGEAAPGEDTGGSRAARTEPDETEPRLGDRARERTPRRPPSRSPCLRRRRPSSPSASSRSRRAPCPRRCRGTARR